MARREKSWRIEVIGETDYLLKTEVIVMGRDASKLITEIAKALSKTTADHVQVFHGKDYRYGYTEGEYFE